MMGRPANYKTAKDLQKKIDDYFAHASKVTITGLALHLGFESRQSFYDYEGREEFSYTIKKARLKVESKYEEMLQGNSCTGAIFALKNLGWKDKQETEHSGTQTLVNVTVDSDKTGEELRRLIDGSKAD